MESRIRARALPTFIYWVDPSGVLVDLWGLPFNRSVDYHYVVPEQSFTVHTPQFKMPRKTASQSRSSSQFPLPKFGSRVLERAKRKRFMSLL